MSAEKTIQKTVLVLGATSAIAVECARLWASQKCNLILVARDAERLEILRADLSVRGAVNVLTKTANFNELQKLPNLVREIWNQNIQIDIVLFAYGTLPDLQICNQDSVKAVESFSVNASSMVVLMLEVARYLEAQRHGTMAVISSVAGDRGRASNAVYGAAKASVSALASALRQRLWRFGVRVMTIKPGFVDTPMTRNFDKGLLWVRPDRVARIILEGIAKDKEVIYAPYFWRFIMFFIRIIPERNFKKMSF